ncbi:protein of unknown function [Pseudomonas sp. JV551A1]|uniref:Uncharacterized protein n=1 Tax=Pseudomonas inefficax TaxID=2078786 RepID=A0AAQ1SR74_9PSED|nr:protein of unknown function [Pseudomonas sp. JV551A1]SPO58307.1 protein of unknown function [Pseudomonas inefficax]
MVEQGAFAGAKEAGQHGDRETVEHGKTSSGERIRNDALHNVIK